MKLLLKIVAFFSAQTVKNQSWLHSYEWYISFPPTLRQVLPESSASLAFLTAALEKPFAE